MGTGDNEIELYEFGARSEYEGPTVFIVGTQDVAALAERHRKPAPEHHCGLVGAGERASQAAADGQVYPS
jgi:hypothetical protein